MRYLVVMHRDVLVEEVAGPDSGLDPEEVDHQEVSRVVLCQDTRAVAKAIREVREGEQWAGIFEVVDGEARSRAIVHKWDGKYLYDVEVR
jgi:hypothetical protein